MLRPLQEYEKRLLAKDHEIKAAQADARELQKRLDQATAELADTSRLIPAAPAAPQGDTSIHWEAEMGEALQRAGQSHDAQEAQSPDQIVLSGHTIAQVDRFCIALRLSLRLQG